jgi:hypothetical protein
MKAIFHPEAHEEMIESARFYEGKGKGLGLDFLTAVEAQHSELNNFPNQFQSTKHIFASDLLPVFRSRFATNFNLIEFSSQPSCINIAGPATGENGLSLEARSRSEQRYWPLSNL